MWTREEKKWHHRGSHSSSVSGSNRLVRLQTWKKAMGWRIVHVEYAAALCENHHENVTQI